MKVTKTKLIDFSKSKGLELIDKQYKIIDVYNGMIIFRGDNLYGLMSLNSKTGKPNIILKPEYKGISIIGDNIIKVTTMNIPFESEFLINYQGKRITKFNYFSIDKFENNLAICSRSLKRKNLDLDKKYGLINKEGKEIINPQFDNLTYIGHGIYLGYNHFDKYTYIDELGNVIYKTNTNYEEIINGNELILSQKKTKITRITQTVKSCFIEGLFNRKGEEILPLKYKAIYKLNDNRFCVKKEHGKNYFIIDRDQNKIKKISSDKRLCSIKYGLIAYKDLQGYIGILDSDGNEFIKFIKPKYDEIIFLPNKLIKLIRPNKCILKNLTGHTIVLTEYDFIGQFENGYAIAGAGEYQDVINEKGKVILRLPNCKLKFLGDCIMAQYENNQKYDLYNLDAQQIESNLDNIILLDNNLFAISKAKKHAIINSQGKAILPYQDLNIMSVIQQKNDLMVIHYGYFSPQHLLNNSYLGLINIQGQEIIKPMELKNIFIVDDETIIVNNHLLRINELDIKYKVNIEYKDINYSKILDKEDYIDDIIEVFNKQLLEQLQKEKELYEKKVKELKGEYQNKVKELKGEYQNKVIEIEKEAIKVLK